MNFRSRLAASLLAASFFSLHAVAAPAGQQAGNTCHLPGYDQSLRCVTVPVPLDYQHPNGEKIRLHVTVAPAFREAAKADPLFVLAGGPGQAGSEILRLLDTSFRKVRATRDIVLIDQRGTGLSGKLDCDSMQSLVEESLPEQEAAVATCMRSLNKPFTFYNTENSSRDLEQIRLALGYAQLNIWGSSYGTRLGQDYARRFPRSVRALILDAVAAPDQIIFAWGRDSQAALDAVFRHCAENAGCKAAFPTLASQFQSVLQRINQGNVELDFRHPRTARRVQMRLSPSRFQQTIRAALYAGDSRSRLPFLIDSADKGNWKPFLAQMYSTTDISVDGPAIGLMLAVTCAEDIPLLTPAIIADEEGNSFLAGSEIKLVSRWCRYVNVPSVRHQQPTVIDAPALLLSGLLDPVTPPRQADSALKYMSRAQHFVVANAGHGVSQLGCAPRLLREFLDQPGRTLAAQCLKEIPPASFQLGNAGPQP